MSEENITRNGFCAASQSGERRKPPGHFGWRLSHIDKKRAATYSPARRSTIGVDGLNFSVRNGKRWNPVAIAT